MMAKTIGHTSTGKPVYAAYQLHRKNFNDWTVNDHLDAADLHRAAARSDIKTNIAMHENSAALHTDDAEQIRKLVERLGLAPGPGGAKKSGAQLDREITASIGTKIDRKKLAELMTPWDTGPVYAVSSYYYSGKKYPDRKIVEQAIAMIDADVPKAERGEHGWTKSDAKDLRTIAAGLRYYLGHDYNGKSSRAHATKRRSTEEPLGVEWSDLAPTGIRVQAHSGDIPLEDATAVEIRKDMNRRLAGFRALTHVPFRRKKWALAIYELAQAKPWVMDQVPHDVWGLVLADVGRGPRP